MRLLLAGIALVTAAPLAAQNLEGRLGQCAAMDSDLRRLACYDRLAETVLPDTSEAASKPTAGYGSWTVQDTINLVDDTQSVFATLPSTSGTNTRGEPIYLVLQCISGETHAIVYWGEYMGSDAVSVTWRIGEAQPETRQWPLSADSQGTFYPRDALDLIGQLLGTDRVVVQASPYSENPITAVFQDLEGINALATRLGEACGWGG